MSRQHVSKEEFEAFIANYPKPLEKDLTGICEPPMLTYNDFSGGKVWPDSVVGSVSLYESFPKGQKFYPYTWEPNKYFIWQEKRAQA